MNNNYWDDQGRALLAFLVILAVMWLVYWVIDGGLALKIEDFGAGNEPHQR